MAQGTPNEKFLQQVDPNRRDFFGRLLGAGFAIPLIATFSIDALSVESAAAQSSNTVGCGNLSFAGVDQGYVGPSKFQARLLDTTPNSRLQGHVDFDLDDKKGLRLLNTHTTVTRDALVMSAQVFVNGTSVASFPDNKGVIDRGSLRCFPDFDAFLEALANKQGSVSITATYAGVTHTLTGAIEALPGNIANLPPA